MSNAFEPLAAGNIKMANRLVMAPMTRSRADGTVPTSETAKYYAQRASAGLIITEGIQPSAVGQGYPSTPGLHTTDQVTAWRHVTDAVHQAGGVIVAQLMHTGRVGHPSNTEAVGHGPLTPVGPSAIRAEGPLFAASGLQDHVVPDELTEDQIHETIGDFASAARNAIEAGFDGVEIHGANGYLLQQFLSTNANQRTDAWGGSVENRIRFTIEVANAVATTIGADRTGIRLSPAIGLGDLVEDDHTDVYPVLVSELDKLNLAYLHLVEAGDPSLTPVLRARWSGTLILNPVGPDIADHAARLDLVTDGLADAVSFARLFISNPDLVARLAAGAELAEPDLSKAYGGDHHGYTDYPTLEELEMA
jgi:N-ethylmaleimide reductase